MINTVHQLDAQMEALIYRHFLNQQTDFQNVKWDYQLISNNNLPQRCTINMSQPNTIENTTPSSESERIDPHLVQWEEFALCLEEHYHAQEMHRRNPNGKPLGHR